MDASKLRDQEIISVAGARRLGTVSEILFHTDPLRVAALKASDDSGDFVVPIERVKQFGHDAVMVETPDARATARDVDHNLRTLEELTTMGVVDEDGNNLGTVRGVEFDPDSGKVEQLSAGSSGGILGGGMSATIRAQAIRGIGADLVTVASSGDVSDRDPVTHRGDGHATDR
jgi:sporulation protein YlmC with PRC-barrel domain